MTHTPTFLHETHPTALHRRNRRTQKLKGVLTVFIVLIVGWLAVFLFAIGQIGAAAFEVKDALLEVKRSAEVLDFTAGTKQLERAQKGIERSEHGFTLLENVFFFQVFREEFQSFGRTLDSTKQLIHSLTSLFALGEDVMQLAGIHETTVLGLTTRIAPSVSFEELPSGTKQAILERLSTASNDFDLLASRITITNEEVAALRAQSLAAPFLSALDPFLRRMESIGKELRVASVFVHLLPELAGLRGERTHLLLFLNNDELRPGGGFIGTYGLMRMKQGEVLSLQTKDVYALDSAIASQIHLDPPAPLKNSGVTSAWFLRDANWSPDFAVSAQQVAAMFEQESALLPPDSLIPASTHIDSVIGFTPTVAASLLTLLGPIEIAGQTFTAENVPDLIEYEVEQGYEERGVPYLQRKEILADLVSEVQKRLVKLPFSEWTSVLDLLSHGFESKQIALYTKQESMQKLIGEVGWGGVLRPQTTDVQMLVDANLGSLKTDPVVSRAIEYSLFRNESGKWIGRTRITYTHNGSFDWRTTRYQSYTRLYVPVGSQLIRMEAGVQNISATITDELGMTSFGTFIKVEPGQEQTLLFEYVLSESVVSAIKENQYTLSLFKQMGARDYPLTLSLDFDKTIKQATPAEKRSDWGDDVYRLNTKLDQDLRFDIGL